jgi:hypothetical protein
LLNSNKASEIDCFTVCHATLFRRWHAPDGPGHVPSRQLLACLPVYDAPRGPFGSIAHIHAHPLPVEVKRHGFVGVDLKLDLSEG